MHEHTVTLPKYAAAILHQVAVDFSQERKSCMDMIRVWAIHIRHDDYVGSSCWQVSRADMIYVTPPCHEHQNMSMIARKIANGLACVLGYIKFKRPTASLTWEWGTTLYSPVRWLLPTVLR